MKKYLVAALIGCLIAGFKLYAPRTEMDRNIAAKSYPGGFQVGITSDRKPPISAGEPFTLTAHIYMTGGTGNFEYQWLFPEEVQVINGNEEPTLTFDSNGRAEAQITLRIPQSDVNYQIHGEAYRYVTVPEEGYLGATAQFNTNPNLLDKVVLPVLKKHRVIH